MATGCIKGDKLVAITERSELGYGHGKSGNWWALRAFGAMCDRETELPYPYTMWEFPAEIRLAVERVLKERGRELELLTPEELARLVERMGGK